jgi:hypothetical protein
MTRNQQRLLQGLIAVLALAAGILYLGVAMGYLDSSLVLYSHGKRAPRIHMPSMWTIWMAGLMFVFVCLALIGEALERRNPLFDLAKVAAWVLFCAILARHAFLSGDPVGGRVFTGVLFAILVFATAYVWWRHVRAKSKEITTK